MEIAAISLSKQSLLHRRELIHTDNYRCRWQPHVETASVSSRRSIRSSTSARCASARLDCRILNVLADLYGEPARLFKDKLIFKPPGSEGLRPAPGLHRLEELPAQLRHRLVPMIHRRDNGCTEVFPGYIRRATCRRKMASTIRCRRGRWTTAKACADAGAGRHARSSAASTPHRSAPNRSDGWRRQLYLSYNAVPTAANAAPNIPRVSRLAEGEVRRVRQDRFTSAERKSGVRRPA